MGESPIAERMGASDRGGSRGAALRALAGREVRVLPWLARWKIAIILAIGAAFRLAQYVADRDLWLDEAALADNIRGKSLAGLFGPLGSAQLAPAGFLAVEWLSARVFGPSDLSLRLFPFVCGIASLFLFSRLAARCLRPDAAWIAVGLFAVADDLIYYASELKQYSTDLAVALECDLLALAIASGEATRSRLAWFAALGAVGVWFSHPSAFVLGGVGTVLILSALARRQWRRALGLVLVSLTWAASFAGAYAVSVSQVGKSRILWLFWDFAFPPMPPASAWDAVWPVRRFAYLFTNPVNFDTPMGARASALLALGLFLAGGMSLWRRGGGEVVVMLMAPVLFVLAAAYLRLYPFHGRLVLFLVPTLLLLMAEGTAVVLRALGRRPLLRAAFLAFLFVLPTAQAVDHLDRPRAWEGRSPQGDRRPGGLDPGRFPF